MARLLAVMKKHILDRSDNAEANVMALFIEAAVAGLQRRHSYEARIVAMVLPR